MTKWAWDPVSDVKWMFGEFDQGFQLCLPPLGWMIALRTQHMVFAIRK